MISKIFKQATIISPIFKGGDKTQSKNYRPVALTSHIIKIFEKCVRNIIQGYMEDHQLFNSHQHSFRKGCSCLSKLLSHYEWITETLPEGKNADVIFFDFATAFDKVDHNILLHKVKSLGIAGNLWTWLHSFLIGRTQRVIMGGQYSAQTAVISGVPQGKGQCWAHSFSLYIWGTLATLYIVPFSHLLLMIPPSAKL